MFRWGKRVIASQGTTLTPLPSGGPTNDQHLLFPSEGSPRRLRETEAGVKGMKWGAKKGEAGVREETRKDVHATLDRILARDIDLSRDDPKKLADALVANTAQLEGMNPKDLVPHIKSWQKTAMPKLK